MLTDFIYVAFKLICFDLTIKRIRRITGVVIDVNGEHLSYTSVLFIDGNAKKKKGYRKRGWKKFISYGYKKLNNRRRNHEKVNYHKVVYSLSFKVSTLSQLSIYLLSILPFLVLSLQIPFSLIFSLFLPPQSKIINLENNFYQFPFIFLYLKQKFKNKI